MKNWIYIFVDYKEKTSHKSKGAGEGWQRKCFIYRRCELLTLHSVGGRRNKCKYIEIILTWEK